MMNFRRSIAALGLLTLCLFAAPTRAQEADVSRGALQSAANQPGSATPERNYILGPGDVLQVDVLGVSNFSTKAKIGFDGTIQLPYLGTLAASNRSTATLRKEIAEALKSGGYFSKPIVQVEVASYASRYVTVLGAVGTPGLIPVDRPYRLSEIIARVGGVREGGADHVTLRSNDGTARTLAIRDLATGNASVDPYVEPGDKIFIPNADIFYVKGQVKAPGEYPLMPNMTLLMALARGGGMTDAGSESDIKIIRKNVEITPKDLNEKIEPDDVIDVGQGWF